ncbi:hypothetical protein QT313_08340 [Escherichia coli]|nr:hypothetical protein [Escherichia coli]MDM4881664.1 hypothetical protein [Escherichia coli]
MRTSSRMVVIAIVMPTGDVDTNGWDGTDRLDLTLNNGGKWVGAAQNV